MCQFYVCDCICIFHIKPKVCFSWKEASVRVAPGHWVDQVYVSTEKKSLKPPQHAAICLSTCSPPLDLCHTLPWRPQGGGRGLFCQPKPCVHCWSGSDYYSPEWGKYEHLCDLKQNLPSIDSLIIYHAAALQRSLLCKNQLNIWKH